MNLNKKNVDIELHTVIDDQGDKESSLIRQKGTYVEKGERGFLRFANVEENIGTIQNHISITPEKVTVKRSGAVSMIQHFIEGKKSECVYRHPFGMFHMELYTYEIQQKYLQKENKITIMIKYDAVINGQEPRAHHLTLTFMEEN